MILLQCTFSLFGTLLYSWSNHRGAFAQSTLQGRGGPPGSQGRTNSRERGGPPSPTNSGQPGSSGQVPGQQGLQGQLAGLQGQLGITDEWHKECYTQFQSPTVAVVFTSMGIAFSTVIGALSYGCSLNSLKCSEEEAPYRWLLLGNFARLIITMFS